MNSNIPYSKKEIAILRAGGYDGSNPKSNAILRKNSKIVFYKIGLNSIFGK